MKALLVIALIAICVHSNIVDDFRNAYKNNPCL